MAFLDENSFKKHISSKKFNNIYVIFGNEKYLVKFYSKDLAEKVAGKEPSEFAYHEFSEEVTLQEIADAVGTVPFMAEYNCVVVKNFDVNKLTKDEYNTLIDILKGVPLSTVVIFSYVQDISKQKEDKDDSSGKTEGNPADDKKEKKTVSRFKTFCNAVDKLGMGAVAEINMRSATSLEHQLSKWADKMGKKLSLPLASKIVYYCSTDLNVLKHELEKVCAYAADSEEITLDMIEATVTKKLEAKIFDMVDYIIQGNAEKTYRELQQLFALKEDPRGVVSVLSVVYIDYYRAKVALESGVHCNEVAEFFGYKNRAWVLPKAQQKTSRISIAALRESLRAITDLAEKFNSVVVNEEAMVTKLIADLLLIVIKERSNA